MKLILAALLLLMQTAASAHPLPVTSDFGWRLHPVTGDYRFHSGVDLGYEEGTTVPALFDGISVIAGDMSDGYGYQVLLYHQATDTYTRYAHLSAVYTTAGENVHAGQVIGTVGSTGRSTGPHLHLEYIARSPSTGLYEYYHPVLLWE